MKINWKVRIRNKTFWVSLVPAALLLIQVIAAVFGIALDFGVGEPSSGRGERGVCSFGYSGSGERSYYGGNL